MKKLFIALCLLTLPLAYGHGQLTASGVMGSDGYSVLRARFDTGVLFIPGLKMHLGYALAQQDGISDMSRYSAGLAYDIPFIDLLEVGAQGGWQPKANQYSNYWYDVYAALNLHEVLFRLAPVDALKLSLGYRHTYHTFHHTTPNTNVQQGDIYATLFQRTGGFDASVTYAKAINYQGDTSYNPPWLDVPGFVSVASGYLDYSLGANAGYTYKFIRPYAAYTLLKRKNLSETDTFGMGLVVQLAGISVNGAVEWFNFSRNTEFRERFFSFSAGVSFL